MSFIYLPKEKKIIATENIALVELDATQTLDELVESLEKRKEESPTESKEIVLIHLKVPAGRILKIKAEDIDSFWNKLNQIIKEK
jgi:hypothetical protein